MAFSRRYWFVPLVIAALLFGACAPAATPTAAPPKPAESKPAATTAPAAPATAPTAAPAAVPTAAPAPTVAPKPVAKALQKMTFTLNSKVPASGVANLYIGEFLGYYAEEGIRMDFTGSDGAGQSSQLLAAKQTDVVSGLQDAWYAAAAKGQMLPIKSAYNYNRGIVYQVGVKPDSPITAIEQLKGKKIGVLSMGHPGMEYAKFALRQVKLDPDKDVEFVAIGQGAPAGLALQSGQVDAVAFWDFLYLQLDKLSFKTRLLPHPPFVEQVKAGHTIAFHNDFIKEKPDLVVGYLRATAKATAFMLENPDAAIRIFFKMFPEAVPTGRPFETAVTDAVDEIKVRAPKVARDPQGKWGFHDKDAWEKYVVYLGLDPNKVNPAGFYTNEFIDKVNQFDETKVREQAKTYKLPN